MDRKPLVLVVEDDYVLLEVLTVLCEREGITIAAASSGEDAMSFLRANPGMVDWLFTDINLPGLIDGWTVAEAYSALNPNRPLVYASAGRRADRAAMPDSVFLRKPFQVCEIVELARMMADPLPTCGLRAAS